MATNSPVMSCYNNIQMNHDLSSVLSQSTRFTDFLIPSPLWHSKPGNGNSNTVLLLHRRRSGWTSGGRMASRICAEWGGIWEECSLPRRLGDLGERRELHQRGPGQSPGRKRILAYFEGYRTLIFVPIWQNLGGGQFALASPTPNFGGLVPLSPRDLCPSITARHRMNERLRTGNCHKIRTTIFALTSW